MTAATERRTVNRRTEDIYRKAIEDTRDFAIFMTDVDGIITNWNIGGRLILGYSEEEIIGKDAARFFTPEDRAKDIPRKEMATAAMSGRAEDERWHVRRDGSRFWASGVMTSVRDQDGKLIGFFKGHARHDRAKQVNRRAGSLLRSFNGHVEHRSPGRPLPADKSGFPAGAGILRRGTAGDVTL
jgi:PAS domain S-box-containing protein